MVIAAYIVNHRAYSLGSRPLHQIFSVPFSKLNESEVNTEIIEESLVKRYDDTRTRAHSLGSKSW